MSLKRISDLDQRVITKNVVEWQSPGGTRYRYERDRAAVGKEMGGGSERYEWYVLEENDLTNAKRRVFELINEDEF
jgi:hypothetical protein